MTAFSASDAALEGFQVLRQHWRIVLGWCLFSVLAFVALMVVAFIAILIGTLAAGSPEQAKAIGGAVGGLTFGLGALVVEVMVIAALYRLMLRPDGPPGLFYLRISRDELRLVGLALVILALTAGLFVLGYLLISRIGRWNGAARIVAALGFGALLLWLWLRSSLAGPANLAMRRLGLAESWKLTRGRFWALAGAALLAFCLLALIAGVLWIFVFVAEAAIGGFHSLAPVSLSDPQALAERPGAYVIGILAELALGPVYWVISAAPFAAIYKTLSEKAA